MCGIFGFIANENCGMAKDHLRTYIKDLIRISEARGREAAGLALYSGENVLIYKHAIKPSLLLKSEGYKDFIDSYVREMFGDRERANRSLAAIGHTRLVTNGTQAIHENNQPVICGDMAGVHNGIITNDIELAERHDLSHKPADIYWSSDTRCLFGTIDHYYQKGHDMADALARTYAEISGSASVAFFCTAEDSLVLATNTGSLYYYYDEKAGFFAFASERYFLERFFRKHKALCASGSDAIVQIAPLTGLKVKIDKVALTKFRFAAKPKDAPVPMVKSDRSRVIDMSMQKKELRRCTKCVLPETYPFIRFDEEGVCNYCRKYKKQEYLGRNALEEVLSKYRSKDGSPDCIVGFSGGRDSSYGLHVLKREFNMHPIAYTYDWALVTDLSRRNQARVTGKLGVEHIIRAADIHAKRRYIRKNIYAWLRKPELGMVPLFMAGDKWFYYYGRKLRQKTGVKLTVFAAGHQLEQMEFKIGFCGVDQHLQNNTKLYHFDPSVKARIALWYIWQYISNPSYINESFFDSIFSYYSSFLNKDDYIYLFRYLPWDEKLIEKTIKDEYGWESDERFGKNQWRMGDGHTAFIDYIYHTLAGFSEFDNFRSNQIREGILTREEAMKLIEEENKPRFEMLQDFSQLIGFNLDDVLLKINSIPKIYQK